MELKDYLNYPSLEDYVATRIERKNIGTARMEEAQSICVNRVLQNHILFDPKRFGPYPELDETPFEKIEVLHQLQKWAYFRARRKPFLNIIDRC